MDGDCANFDMSLTYINTYSLIITHEVYELESEDTLRTKVESCECYEMRVEWTASLNCLRGTLYMLYPRVQGAVIHTNNTLHLFVLISSSSVLPLQFLFYLMHDRLESIDSCSWIVICSYPQPVSPVYVRN